MKSIRLFKVVFLLAILFCSKFCWAQSDNLALLKLVLGTEKVTTESIAELLNQDLANFHVKVLQYDWKNMNEDDASALVGHWVMEQGNENAVMLQGAHDAATDVIRRRYENGDYKGRMYQKWNAQRYLFNQGTSQEKRLRQVIDRDLKFEKMILAGINKTIAYLLVEKQYDFILEHEEKTVPALLRLAANVEHKYHHSCVLALKEYFPDQKLPEEVLKIQAAAEKEDAEAQNYMGLRNYYGKDYESAASWFRKAAENGSAAGKYYLGNRFAFGEGVERDEHMAFKLFQDSAKQGYAPAQHNLAACYLEGKEVKQDTQQALAWYLKSAEQGHAPSQVSLSVIHFKEEYGVQDDDQVFKWALKAAEQGNADGQSILASCYADGMGGEQDQQQAFQWFTKAAEQNHMLSQFFVGVMHATGMGTEIDLHKARFWLTCAANQGLEDAKVYLSSIQ